MSDELTPDPPAVPAAKPATQARNPLHGVTLEAMVTALSEQDRNWDRIRDRDRDRNRRHWNWNRGHWYRNGRHRHNASHHQIRQIACGR